MLGGWNGVGLVSSAGALQLQQMLIVQQVTGYCQG